MNAKRLISKAAVKIGVSYITKDPMKNLHKLVDWADGLVVLEDHKKMVSAFRGWINDPTCGPYKLIERYFTQLNPEVRKKFLVNFFINAGMDGIPRRKKMQEEANCNIPWAVLMDPTAACNIKCIGCWAGEYDKTDAMDYDTLDRIIREGKELGIYMFIYSGGEPLMRRDDILKLAQVHDDCIFLSFTNGTLIDEEYAEKIAKAGNFLYAISIEGDEESTDMRRGKGVYAKVVETMRILKKHGIPFGFSACYTSKNVDQIANEDWIDLMVEYGCLFGWYFTYMPIGADADLSLLASAEDRERMYYHIRDIRSRKPIFLLDFWNDGEYVNGCIAGGRQYIHISAAGDVEPCAFIHYANCNIKETSLLKALQSPLFAEYRKNQPFNDNQLRPCPLLDNPEKLRMMVKNAGAYSSQPIDKEPIDSLCDKCVPPSEAWAKKAQKIWDETPEEIRTKFDKVNAEHRASFE
ncbi:MAG: radical SAM protein [Bacillota bacterium]|jgi:MoaA/NifB/PqqE/SkfB family radical SAM enzyme